MKRASEDLPAPSIPSIATTIFMIAGYLQCFAQKRCLEPWACADSAFFGQDIRFQTPFLCKAISPMIRATRWGSEDQICRIYRKNRGVHFSGVFSFRYFAPGDSLAVDPVGKALPKKRCLELSGAQNSSIYWVGEFQTPFFGQSQSEKVRFSCTI